MDWGTIAALIVNYGVPFAEKIVAKWESKATPSTADFVELKQLESANAADEMKSVLARNNISLDSSLAKDLIALSQ
jgi:hypothetical protein